MGTISVLCDKSRDEVIVWEIPAVVDAADHLISCVGVIDTWKTIFTESKLIFVERGLWEYELPEKLPGQMPVPNGVD